MACMHRLYEKTADLDPHFFLKDLGRGQGLKCHI